MLVVCAITHISGVVNYRRSSENFLETMNLCLLPLGLISVMAGQYMANDAALASSPITSFGFSCSGIVLVALSFVGCFGTAADSRGMLKIYSGLMTTICMIMVTSGVAALSIAEHATEQITARWEQLRVLLPPTFSGKYDKYQFTLFVESNLYLMGYAAVIFGVLLGLQAYAAIVLRAKLKQETNTRLRQDAKEKREQAQAANLRGGMGESSINLHAGNRPRYESSAAAGAGAGANTGANSNAALGNQSPAWTQLLKQQWKQKYKQGSDREKKLIKAGGCFCCLILLVIIAITVVALVFTTLCGSLTR